MQNQILSNGFVSWLPHLLFWGSAPNPVKGLSPLKPAIFLQVSIFCQMPSHTKDAMGPLPHFDKNATV